MTLKNNRAPLLCCFKLCASFHSHQWIQAGVTVRKRQILVKIDNFYSRVTLKFYWWPSKTIGQLFYSIWSFVQHFLAIGEVKNELQSRNAQSGSNSTIFSAVWPWNLTDDLEKTIGHLSWATSSYMHHFIIICEFKLELESGKLGRDLCDFDLWSLTLTFCMDLTLVLADISWKCHDDTVMET